MWRKRGRDRSAKRITGWTARTYAGQLAKYVDLRVFKRNAANLRQPIVSIGTCTRRYGTYSKCKPVRPVTRRVPLCLTSLLTAGIRQNLLSLQQTSADLTTTQEALATGKAVNSAAENPSAYFTSQNLTNSANSLSALLDQIGQGQQTINAATNGLTGFTSLLATGAVDGAAGAAVGATDGDLQLAITGNTPIAADTSQATGTAAYSTSGFTASSKLTYTIDTSGGVGAEGDTIKINYNGQAYTFQNDNLGTGVAAGNISYTSKADLGAAIQSIFGAGNVDVGSDSITITGSDYTHSLTDGGGTITGTAQAAVDGTKFTITQGSTTATLHYVASGADASAGTFTSLSDLEAAINASSVGNSGGPTLASTVLASDDGSNHWSSNRSAPPPLRWAVRLPRPKASAGRTSAPTTIRPWPVLLVYYR